MNRNTLFKFILPALIISVVVILSIRNEQPPNDEPQEVQATAETTAADSSGTKTSTENTKPLEG